MEGRTGFGEVLLWGKMREQKGRRRLERSNGREGGGGPLRLLARRLQIASLAGTPLTRRNVKTRRGDAEASEARDEGFKFRPRPMAEGALLWRANQKPGAADMLNPTRGRHACAIAPDLRSSFRPFWRAKDEERAYLTTRRPRVGAVPPALAFGARAFGAHWPFARPFSYWIDGASVPLDLSQNSPETARGGKIGQGRWFAARACRCWRGAWRVR